MAELTAAERLIRLVPHIAAFPLFAGPCYLLYRMARAAFEELAQ